MHEEPYMGHQRSTEHKKSVLLFSINLLDYLLHIYLMYLSTEGNMKTLFKLTC